MRDTLIVLIAATSLPATLMILMAHKLNIVDGTLLYCAIIMGIVLFTCALVNAAHHVVGLRK